MKTSIVRKQIDEAWLDMTWDEKMRLAGLQLIVCSAESLKTYVDYQEEMIQKYSTKIVDHTNQLP